MATPKILSEEEIARLLEDRKNGVGLQKVAKKYGIGIPKIRRIERENGLEVAIPEKPPTTSTQQSTQSRLLYAPGNSQTEV